MPVGSGLSVQQSGATRAVAGHVWRLTGARWAGHDPPAPRSSAWAAAGGFFAWKMIKGALGSLLQVETDMGVGRFNPVFSTTHLLRTGLPRPVAVNTVKKAQANFGLAPTNQGVDFEMDELGPLHRARGNVCESRSFAGLWRFRRRRQRQPTAGSGWKNRPVCGGRGGGWKPGWSSRQRNLLWHPKSDGGPRGQSHGGRGWQPRGAQNFF